MCIEDSVWLPLSPKAGLKLLLLLLLLADVPSPLGPVHAQYSLRPVWWEAHGHDCCHVQVCCLVHNALSHHTAPLIHHREEQELNDVLQGRTKSSKTAITLKGWRSSHQSR
jgi:hypothetical protein